MMAKKDVLRQLPKVDDLLVQNAVAKLEEEHGHAALLLATRQVVDTLRQQILAGTLLEVPGQEWILKEIAKVAGQNAQPTFKKIINATGVVLHTNLGRAVMPKKAAQAAFNAAVAYSNLEYDIASGQRGSRHSLVSGLLCQLCGAQDAMVVNNNASAVLLMLSAIAKGGQVVVSRGELVEIGGSFRVPDIMALSGAVMREVGTTNRTHLKDYEDVLCQETAALLKVHTSNYKVVGFTKEIGLDEMVELGKKHGLPVLYDLGGGLLRPIAALPLDGEPNVVESLASGADVICFSGDKLLGGPQAGILLGKKQYIEKMKKHPLARALRVDKMSLAALEAVLNIYKDEEAALCQVPTLQMLTAQKEGLVQKAKALAKMLAKTGVKVQVVEEKGQVGGGTAPGVLLPGAALAISAKTKSPEELAAQLRQWPVPIVGRIAHDKLVLDLRTVETDDFEHIAQCFCAIFADMESGR